jgi:hypothetical protein
MNERLQAIYNDRLENARLSIRRRQRLSNNHPGLKGYRYQRSRKIQDAFTREIREAIDFVNDLYKGKLKNESKNT